MAKGLVKWFSSDKGYGFVLSDQGIEIFVHFSDIQIEGYKILRKGQSVEYEVVDGDKGPIAQNVVPLLKK
jgi:CspA family cold shock protein